MQSREEVIRAIHGELFDLCVIGGGATGAGCALEAQLRGLRTLLIDAGDFASATSSASTKLVHGGVRYLEQAVKQFDLGQFKVVRQALHERTQMLNNAPHLAHPRQFVIPCFSRFENFYYGLGVRFYDWLAGAENLAPSHALSREETLHQFPDLNNSGITGSVVYTDGQFDDARYCLAILESFARLGGRAGSYLKLISFEFVEGKLASAIVEDQFTNQRFSIRARAFLNATGPFSDSIRALAGNHSPRLVLSRGVHILLPLTFPDRSPALLIPKTEDGRVIFAIPWMGRLLVGTTDRQVPDMRESLVARQEAEYLLRHLNRYRRAPRGLNEIVSAFSGVRPLVRAGHARQTKRLIRDHEVELDPRSGLISILGGKWTTYRAMADDAVNQAQQELKLAVEPSRSANYLLAGASGYSADYATELCRRHNISQAQALHLASKYGTDADEVCAIAQRDLSQWRLVADGFLAIEAEIAYSIRSEMAMTIEDVLARRTGLQYYSWALAAKAASKVAKHFVRERGWSEQQSAQVLYDYSNKLRQMQTSLGLLMDPEAGGSV
jgi:glycerol-3-phosphate dehydrogenase